MTTTIPAIPDHSSMATATTADLHRQLGEAIGITAHAIRAVAAIWTELERRGEDMSHYRFALRSYMTGVASGRILPETVAALAGQRRTLDAVAALPVAEQQRVIGGAALSIARTDGHTIEKPLEDMSFPEVAQVIRDGQILTVDEQMIYLKRAARSQVKRESRGRPVRVTVVDDGLNLRVGHIVVPLERVIAALRASGAIG